MLLARDSNESRSWMSARKFKVLPSRASRNLAISLNTAPCPLVILTSAASSPKQNALRPLSIPDEPLSCLLPHLNTNPVTCFFETNLSLITTQYYYDAVWIILSLAPTYWQFINTPSSLRLITNMGSDVDSAKGSSSGQGVYKDDKFREKYKKLMGSLVPYDPRFPNQNQTRNCQTNYIDYYRCLKAKNGDEEYCAWYKNAYQQLCPGEWVEKWDEQRENGSFPIRDVL